MCKGLQQIGLAGRHTYFCARCMQRVCAGQANTAGSTHQPDTATAPVGDGGVERGEPSHGCQARRVNDNVTSPRKMPNLDMAALLSMTLSSSKYIQSSNCTCQT
ncbi:MAG: zinc finger domain-containing protein [Limnohabitans sp.]